MFNYGNIITIGLAVVVVGTLVMWALLDLICLTIKLYRKTETIEDKNLKRQRVKKKTNPGGPPVR